MRTPALQPAHRRSQQAMEIGNQAAAFFPANRRIKGTAMGRAEELIKRIREGGAAEIQRMIAEPVTEELWPAPGSKDTELGVLMGQEVGHGIVVLLIWGAIAGRRRSTLP